MKRRPGRTYEGRKPQAYGLRTSKMNVIGPRIRQARLDMDPQWSLEELSQHLVQETGLDLSPSTLSKIETGVRSVYDFEVQAFARVLAVPLNSLFEVEVSGESPSGEHSGAVNNPPD